MAATDKGKKPIRGDNSKAKSHAKGPKGGKRKHPTSNKASGAAKKPTYQRPESLKGLPGAAKLKSSIRQTKRLLAKPNLAPGTKIEAERRLGTLTADLEKLQGVREEKNISARYHKVKFFERQKLVRKIKQTKRKIAQIQAKAERRSDSDASGSRSDSDDEGESVEELEKRLQELRCLFHYVLRYPANLPYVGLFAHGAKEPQLPQASETDATQAKAYKVLEQIRASMAASELSAQPEVDLESGESADRRTKLRSLDVASAKKDGDKSARRVGGKDEDEDEEMEDDGEEMHGVEGDDFFARDSDDDDEGGEDDGDEDDE
ncbi:18S rRNA maturation protein [Thecaphora frezii]